VLVANTNKLEDLSAAASGGIEAPKGRVSRQTRRLSGITAPDPAQPDTGSADDLVASRCIASTVGRDHVLLNRGRGVSGRR
jgi:hypothetical protein